MSESFRTTPPPPPPVIRRRGGNPLGGCFKFVMIILLVMLVIGFVTQLVVSRGGASMLVGNSVGVVRIEGPINDSRKIIKILKRMRENRGIEAVVLRLDTPGGSVGASEEIHREVLRLRTGEKKKPVVVSMGNVAASGGYYIAAAADYIYANNGTITGSIGVISPGINFEETARKLGIRSAVIKSGEHKDTGSPLSEMTPEDRNLLQHLIWDAYRQFIRVVLEGRHKAIQKALENPVAFNQVAAIAQTKRPGEALEWEAFTTGTVAMEVGATTESETALRMVADGRVMTGEQAKWVGLVDEIGGQEDAIKRAARMAGLDDDPFVIEREPESGLPSWLGVSIRQAWEAFAAPGPRIEYR